MFAFTSRRLAALVAFPLLAAAKPVSGTPVDGKPHVIDKAHSEINFVADSRLLSAHGFFGKWDADVKLDAANWSNSTVAITIDAASINTRVDMRDNHLKSADFFDVAKFPTITFKSTGIEKKGDGYLVHGDLTIRGVTKPVTLETEVSGPHKNPWGKSVVGLSASTTVNRKDFGVNFNAPLETGGLLISEKVKIEIEIEVTEET